MSIEDVAPPGETGCTLDLDQVLCLVAALDVYSGVIWDRMPRAGSRAYHAKGPVLGRAYVLRGRLVRRAQELAQAAGVSLDPIVLEGPGS